MGFAGIEIIKIKGLTDKILVADGFAEKITAPLKSLQNLAIAPVSFSKRPIVVRRADYRRNRAKMAYHAVIDSDSGHWLSGASWPAD